MVGFANKKTLEFFIPFFSFYLSTFFIFSSLFSSVYCKKKTFSSRLVYIALLPRGAQQRAEDNSEGVYLHVIVAEMIMSWLRARHGGGVRWMEMDIPNNPQQKLQPTRKILKAFVFPSFITVYPPPRGYYSNEPLGILLIPTHALTIL